jgi:hypothetical protein
VDRDQAAREHLGLRWVKVQARASAYIGRAETGVARWEWLSGDALPEVPAPITLEPLQPAPENHGEAMHVGYDADGEILVVRYFADGEPFVEAVVVDGVVLRFLHERGTLVLEQLIHATHTDDGHLDVIREWNRELASITWYAWDEDRPSHAVKENYDGELGISGKLIDRTRTDYEHDAQGLLRISERVSGEEAEILWVRSSPEALEAAHALVLEQLPQRIRAWVARVAPRDEPVSALALLHSLEDPSLPPALALGTADEVAAGASEFDRWDGLPDELIGDARLDDAYALLERHWQQTNALDEPEATLRACARHLRALDWSDVLTPAETFAVFVAEI